jgi:hypothetical protein
MLLLKQWYSTEIFFGAVDSLFDFLRMAVFCDAERKGI